MAHKMPEDELIEALARIEELEAEIEEFRRLGWLQLDAHNASSVDWDTMALLADVLKRRPR